MSKQKKIKAPHDAPSTTGFKGHVMYQNVDLEGVYYRVLYRVNESGETVWFGEKTSKTKHGFWSRLFLRKPKYVWVPLGNVSPPRPLKNKRVYTNYIDGIIFEQRMKEADKTGCLPKEIQDLFYVEQEVSDNNVVKIEKLVMESTEQPPHRRNVKRPTPEPKTTEQVLDQLKQYSEAQKDYTAGYHA